MFKNKEQRKLNADRYYIVTEEWLYPTESGRNVLGDYDTAETALDAAKELADNEMSNFYRNCDTDPLYPELCRDNKTMKDNGYIISPRNGLDDWYYRTRVIEVDMGS